jgi:hypothetical protein
MSGSDGSSVTIGVARCAHHRSSPPELRIGGSILRSDADYLAVSVCLERRKVVAPKQLRPNWVNDRDRGTPRGAAPPTPPGIRVTYLGGSTRLSFNAQY